MSKKSLPTKSSTKPSSAKNEPKNELKNITTHASVSVSSTKPKTKKVSKTATSFLNAMSDAVVQVLTPVLSLNATQVQSVGAAFTENADKFKKLIKMSTSTPSGKKTRDPNAPKRGKASYIFFCVENREKVKQSNPDMEAKDIIKELGRIWRSEVSEKDKLRYNNMSVQDKSRYEEESKDYVPPPDLVSSNGKKKRSGPKRGLTAYIFFCKDARAQIKIDNPEMPTKDITAELGRRWQELTDKDKKPYLKLAQDDKDRYDSEKESWVEPENDVQKTKKASTKSKPKASSSSSKTGAKKTTEKPKTEKKKSGYNLFCKEERESVKEDHRDWSTQQVTKELSRAWNELSDEEKAEYNNRTSESS